MNCKEAKELIYGLFDSGPDREAQERLKKHLARCNSCAEEYVAARRVLDSTRKIQTPEPGEEYWSDFLPRLRNRIEKEEND